MQGGAGGGATGQESTEGQQPQAPAQAALKLFRQVPQRRAGPHRPPVTPPHGQEGLQRLATIYYTVTQDFHTHNPGLIS